MTTKTDRDREDQRTFRRLNIVFRPMASEWPVQHLKTFQKISTLGLMRYTEYCTDQNDEAGSDYWKCETKARCQRLVDTVTRLARNQSSEMQWRLDIEKIVYKRFELKIECPSCKKRSWRSQIEAEPEISNEVTRSLQKRRDCRVPCSCNAEDKLKTQGSVGLSSIFDYRADEFIVHGGEAHYDLRPRKPDRVYGLQQTKFFTQAIQAITADIQDHVTEQAEIEERFKQLQFTPFEERARPLIFPFLISEAKTERGDSFDACKHQTAFPIWTLLRMQEVLQIRSKQPLTEQGGSFVWFFANRGEEWRLYACFTDIDEDSRNQHTTYNVQDLWTGRLDSRDGALQILLIVDYIFDWARDIYRHGIARLLKTLSRNAAGQGRSDASSISLDTDFSSISHSEIASQQAMELDHPVVAWQQQMELDPPSPQSSALSALSEITEKPKERFEQWQTTDTVCGAFRNPAIIERCFECIHFTNDIFNTLLAPFLAGDISEEFLRQFSSRITDAFEDNEMVICEDDLSYLEEQWTGNLRLSDSNTPRLSAKRALIFYYVHFSERWRPRRVIACIVLDDSIKPITRNQHRGNIESIRDLAQHLKSQSIKDNLAAAIETQSKFCGSSTRLQNSNVRPPSHFGLPAFFQILRNISSENPRGSLEPLARFSTVVECQLKPLSFHGSGSKGNSVLVYRESIEEQSETARPKWCLFCLDANNDVPSLKKQFSLLAGIREEDGFYITKNFLDEVKEIRHWWLSSEWHKAAKALAEWKRMLESLYTIKYLANVAETDPLALSSSIKRYTTETNDVTFGNKTKAWNMLKVKKELVEESSIINEEESSISDEENSFMLFERLTDAWERLKVKQELVYGSSLKLSIARAKFDVLFENITEALDRLN